MLRGLPLYRDWLANHAGARILTLNWGYNNDFEKQFSALGIRPPLQTKEPLSAALTEEHYGSARFFTKRPGSDRLGVS